jgi:hypothetical protein
MGVRGVRPAVVVVRGRRSPATSSRRSASRRTDVAAWLAMSVIRDFVVSYTDPTRQLTLRLA